MNYPSILRRYLATFIDGCFIFAAFFAVSYGLNQQGTVVDILRVGLILLFFFAYEPICTSRFCTIGQKLMHIRVRRVSNLEKISIPAAYLRILVKIVLGFISLLAIVFSKDRRALHDFAAGSIVISQD